MGWIAFSIAVLFLIGPAAAQTQKDAVNVHVVVASGGSAYRAISPRAAEISAKNGNSAGKNIVVTFVYVRPDDFQHFVRTVTPIDIVICDSAEQLNGSGSLKREAEKGVNACGGAGRCPAFIFSTLTPDRKTAIQQVFQTITQR